MIGSLKESLVQTAPRKALTVGQICRLLSAATKTVTKWIDDDKMRGFRLPPGAPGAHGDRRVFAKDVAQFCIDFGIPIPAELSEPLLLVACMTVDSNDPIWEIEGVEIVTGGSVEIAYRMAAPGRLVGLVCGCEEGIATAQRLAALLPANYEPRPLIVREETIELENLRMTQPPVNWAAEARLLLDAASHRRIRAVPRKR